EVAFLGLGDLVEDPHRAERDGEHERYDDHDGELDPYAPVARRRPRGPPAGGRPVVRCHVGLSPLGRWGARRPALAARGTMITCMRSVARVTHSCRQVDATMR